MSERMIFDYYYGREADQFAFYRIPKMLIKDARFSGLSSDAKILYGLMLDRMSLSIRNEWQDEEDRTYIIYTIEQIMEDLNCGKNKAIRVMAELDADNGIGLVERIRRGLGRPDIIYVKNFVGIERETERNDVGQDRITGQSGTEKRDEKNYKIEQFPEENRQEFQNETSAGLKSKLQEVPEPNVQEFQKETSRSPISRPQEVSEPNLQGFQKQTSRGPESKLQEVSEPNFQKFQNETSRSPESKPPEVSKANLQRFQNETSGSFKMKPPEVSKANFKKSQNETSRSPESKPQEVSKSGPIKNNMNNTDLNNTDLSDTDFSDTDGSIHPSIYPSDPSVREQSAFFGMDGSDERDRWMESVRQMRERIKENICYSDLLIQHPYDRAKIDELVEIMVEACTSGSTVLRIGKEVRPQALVRSRFEKFDHSMMEYVLSCLTDNSTKVHNIKSYLLTTLYNAPVTIENYYHAEVSHDMQHFQPAGY